MAQKKDLKYYLMIFGIAALAILIYVVISWIGTGELDTTLFAMVFVLPGVFTVFLFVFDKILEKLFPKRMKQNNKKNGYDQFLVKINKALNKETNFLIQDYRTLQDSDRFQKTLHQLYTIQTEGEKPDLTYEYLGKKFKKTTVEYKAIQIIIKEVKKLD